MKTFKNEIFEGFRDRNSARVFADMEFIDCVFDDCFVSIADEVIKRSTIRNMRFTNCTVKGSGVKTGIIEDVIVDGLKTNGKLLQIWGAVFKNVVLKGKIDRLMLSPAVVLSDPESPVNKAFSMANAEYYNTVDWALDISQAEANELEIQGVPARLILRDAETQVVVTADKAIKNCFDKFDYGDTHWKFSIQFMLNRGEKDIVLVAPKKNPKFKILLAGLQMLRNAGIAEPE